MTFLCYLSFALLALPASFAMDFATDSAHKLEETYIADCQSDTSPHGYYGAFLQPCEFTFRQVDDSHMILNDNAQDYYMCSDDQSKVVGSPIPMNWSLNLTEHFDKNDWDDMSWDDMSSDDLPEIMDKLLLWPDQCVGVTPRCYSVNDAAIRDTLSKLFTEIPEGATHVQVNCQSDAMALSRVVYAVADGFEKSMPTIIAWMTTVILFSLVATLWCFYGCFRLVYHCNSSNRGNNTPSIVVAARAHPVNNKGVYTLVEDEGEDEFGYSDVKKSSGL
jgi:hypothetical protein